MYTGSFQFAQLEQSPHVRTAGRAFYHGSWGRPDPPKDASAGDSDSSSTSASSEGSGDSAGVGPEIEGGSSGEDWEEEMEEGAFGLDGTAGKDNEETAAVAGANKKGSKRRFAWGWPKKKGEEEKKKKRRKRKRGGSHSGGDYVDDPGTRKGAAGGFGDSSDDDGDGAGGQADLKKRKNKDSDKNKSKEEKKKRKKKKKKKQRAQEKSKPHGEGYVEFLDGWGVSQVGTYRKLDCWFCWATASWAAFSR